MWEALKKVEARFAELSELLGRPEVSSDPRKVRDLSKERAALEPTIRATAEHRKLARTIADDEQAIASGDPVLAELAGAELPQLQSQLGTVVARRMTPLHPSDPHDSNN